MESNDRPTDSRQGGGDIRRARPPLRPMDTEYNYPRDVGDEYVLTYVSDENNYAKRERGPTHCQCACAKDAPRRNQWRSLSHSCNYDSTVEFVIQ